jgi:two-component system phosphate regulon sensor histidine kinase PhoR
MRRDWSSYIHKIILGLVLLCLLGFFAGSISWFLVAGLSLYTLWSLTQSIKLYKWLNAPHPSPPPESHGLWGDLFDGIHQLQIHNARAQDRLQLLVNRVQESTNALKDAVIMTNHRGSLEWWNHSASELLGFQRKTDFGQPIFNLVRHPAFKRYFQLKDYKEPLEIPSPTRPHIILMIQITLFGDDDRLIIAQDTTRIHNLEEMRRNFVSNVSHEMRTPLTVISGYLETFKDYSDQLPKRWAKGLETMSAQAKRMENLISDLIILAKLETGESINRSLQPCSISDLLSLIIKDAEALSGEHHTFHLRTEEATGLLGDEDQLRSAFSNIIFNAVKYTPNDGVIDINWWSDALGAHLSVKDTGIGFDPIHIPRLTERFYRADPSRHHDTGGSGLGLAIVKHVLLNHDGQLEVKSLPGKGSEFICHFPLSRQHSSRVLLDNSTH